MGKDFDLKKLAGSDNYHTWQYAMTNFLALKGLSNCIKHRPNKPAAGTAPEIVYADDVAIETDTGKIDQAKGHIVLAIDESIYVHVQKCETALGVWNCLKKLYEDKGLYRKIALLSGLLSNKLDESNGMQDYVDKIASAANKLSGIGFPVNDEWLGAILLSGLTDVYRPFILGLEANGSELSGDLIMSKLLDSIGTASDQNIALMSKHRRGRGAVKKRKCFNCGSYKHLANSCDQPKREKPNKTSDKSAKAAFTMGLLSASECKEEWYLDSGATKHMTPHGDLLNSTKPVTDTITTANGGQVQVHGIGNGNFTFNDGDITVSNVLHVPDLAVNLLSISQIAKNGNEIVFNSDGCTVFNSDGKMVLFSKETNGIYKIKTDSLKCLLTEKESSVLVWHRKLGHASYGRMKETRDGAVLGVKFTGDNSEILNCEICAKAKQTKQPFKPSESKSNDILELIHSDLMGPMPTLSIGKKKYVLTFIDDYSRKVFVFFLHQKTETFNKFTAFKKYIENHWKENQKVT